MNSPIISLINCVFFFGQLSFRNEIARQHPIKKIFNLIIYTYNYELQLYITGSNIKCVLNAVKIKSEDAQSGSNYRYEQVCS